MHNYVVFDECENPFLCPFTERGFAPLSGVNPKDWGFFVPPFSKGDAA